MYTHRPSHNRTVVNAVNADATADPNTSEPADTSVNAVRHPKPPAKRTADPGPTPMILNLILSHNSVSGHFCKEHGNLYMTAKSIFQNSNLLENAFLIWHRTH